MTAFLATLPQAVAQTDLLRESLRYGGEADRTLRGIAACLVPMLSALGWRGDPNQLVESLPHFVRDPTIDDLRDTLGILGFPTMSLTVRAERLDGRMLPCLYETSRGEIYVLIERVGERIRVFDPDRGGEYNLNPHYWRGRAYVLDPAPRDDLRQPAGGTAWFPEIIRRFKSLLVLMFFASMITNTLALVVPLSIMVIYDQVIGRQSGNFLPSLSVGIVIALAVEFLLRMVRTRGQAFLSARLEFLIGTRAFAQILHLPYAFIERAPVGKQLARIKEFESLRDFFTGPLVTVAFDLPFVIIFLTVIGLIAGPVILIPLGLIVIYGILGLLIFPAMRRRVKAASNERAERHAFVVETLGQMRSIKLMGAEDIWYARFRSKSANAAMSAFQANYLTSVVQTLSHILMVFGGVGVLALGVDAISTGAMSMGALIATMALTWRVLAPIQTGFNLIARLEQVVLSIRQFHELLRLKVERAPDQAVGERKIFSGTLAFHRVSLRYLPQHEPALLGVSFSARKGEVVALAGPSGSGKSSLLSLALRLYEPQGGTITLDGIDIRQLDPVELRRAVAFVPQQAQVLYGTIAQNLRFGNLSASDRELSEACDVAGLLDDINALPDGFDTRIGDNRSLSLPAGFHQSLALARAYLSPASVLLLDEAANALDGDGDRKFCAAINGLRGTRTVLMVTHRPSHMMLADRVVAMVNGELAGDGTPEEIVPKLTGKIV